MITDLAEVRRLAEEKRAENLEFRRFLSAHHEPEGPFRILAAEVAEQIDCRTCGNCCRETLVEVSDAEVNAIAGYLGIEPADVVHLYTVLTAKHHHGDRVLKNEPDGCVFLDGNLCMIYDVRPKCCRDFPHLAHEIHSPAAQFDHVCRRSAICPIVFNALEQYKHDLGFHAHARAAGSGA